MIFRNGRDHSVAKAIEVVCWQPVLPSNGTLEIRVVALAGSRVVPLIFYEIQEIAANLSGKISHKNVDCLIRGLKRFPRRSAW